VATPHNGQAVADPVEVPLIRSQSKAGIGKALEPLLLSAADLAELLRVSVATVWRLRAAGKLPRPSTALGKQLVRWNREEIDRWVALGCPPLATWEGVYNR
jgi:excisionase family DNA binding protein